MLNGSKKSLDLRFFIFTLWLFLGACSIEAGPGNSDDRGDNGGSGNQVNWEKVSADMNPQTETYSYTVQNINQLSLNIFGFSRDVRAFRMLRVPKNQVEVRVYRVWQKFAQWGAINASFSPKELELWGRGNYQCSIQIQNGLITQLEGGCIVRIDVYLPEESRLRVMNAGNSIPVVRP